MHTHTHSHWRDCCFVWLGVKGRTARSSIAKGAVGTRFLGRRRLRESAEGFVVLKDAGEALMLDLFEPVVDISGCRVDMLLALDADHNACKVEFIAARAFPIHLSVHGSRMVRVDWRKVLGRAWCLLWFNLALQSLLEELHLLERTQTAGAATVTFS